MGGSFNFGLADAAGMGNDVRDMENNAKNMKDGTKIIDIRKKCLIWAAAMGLCLGLSAQVPTITNISPTSGRPGTVVTLTGTNFGTGRYYLVSVEGNRVDVHGLEKTGTTIKFVVPISDTPDRSVTGKISVSAYEDDNDEFIGTAVSTQDFTLNPLPTLSITNISPTSLYPGEVLTITGTGFPLHRTLISSVIVGNSTASILKNRTSVNDEGTTITVSS